ncbi:MAG TPA: aminopeptidase P family protein [Eubacteriaceae bacterium]|jgi:Xaa-Pro aminopeptidase|nr:aminopeptidase P family protein [Eubacteriaceae bacterium]
MDKSFFMENRTSLINRIDGDSILILFSGSPIHRSADGNYPFLVNRNFYYLTGLEEEDIILIIRKGQDKIEEELFINQADPLLEKWVGKKYTREEARNISGISKIGWRESFQQRLINILNEYDYKNIYLDLGIMDWNIQDHKALGFSQGIIQRFPYLGIKNAYPILRDLRTIKRPEEIVKIKKAIEITSKGIESILREIKAGLKEYQLEAVFNFTIKFEGARDNAFDPIVASGENATILHYVENQEVVKEGDLVLFDIGADYEHYCGDISRTFPVSRKFSPRQKILYNIVLKAQEEVIKAIKPGLHFSKLNEIAKNSLAEGCMEIGLIKEKEELSNYYYHGVSHYLGLDTHDIGNRNRVLEPGMVITVEPGLYIEEESIGIRIEDDILVTENGCDILSKDIPKTIEEIERIMEYD